MKGFSVTLALLFFASLAFADARDKSRTTIAALRQSGISQKMPDEMDGINSVFNIAESFYEKKEFETADRYFILAIQMSQVLMATKKDRNPYSALHSNVPPGNNPIGGQVTSESDQEDDSDETIFGNLIGNTNVYTVMPNDTLKLVAAKLGVNRQHLARMNKLDSKAVLKVGQKLKYNNRKIIPRQINDGIVINIPELTLYYFKLGKLAASMPVALGSAPKNKKHDWKTPTGKFKIIAKQKDPTWFVPHSIRSEMESVGKGTIASVPPGPQNPLGKYAIKTSLPGILIHSTIKPGSIYSFASHGCIRVSPIQMEEFFKEIKINTPGEIIYEPVKLAVTMKGSIFLEVHQDAYGMSAGLGDEAKRMIEKHNLSDRVDWKKVESVIRQKEGIAKEITLSPEA